MDIYFKHSATAMSHPALVEFAKRRKADGLGIYWYLRERLNTFYGERCNLEQLKQLVVRGVFSYAKLKEVLLEPNLFRCQDGYYSPVDLFDRNYVPEVSSPDAPEPVRRRAKRTAVRMEETAGPLLDEAEEMAENHPVPLAEKRVENTRKECGLPEEESAKDDLETARKCPKIEENHSKIEEKCSKIEEKCAEIEEKCAENVPLEQDNLLKTNENSVSASSRAREEEKEAVDIQYLLLLKEWDNLSCSHYFRQKLNEKAGHRIWGKEWMGTASPRGMPGGVHMGFGRKPVGFGAKLRGFYDKTSWVLRQKSRAFTGKLLEF